MKETKFGGEPWNVGDYDHYGLCPFFIWEGQLISKYTKNKNQSKIYTDYHSEWV